MHDLEAGGLCLAGEASHENLLLRERAADGERFRHCTVYAVLTLFSLVSPPSRPLMSPLRPQRRCTPRALCWSSLWPDQLAESLSGPEAKCNYWDDHHRSERSVREEKTRKNRHCRDPCQTAQNRSVSALALAPTRVKLPSSLPSQDRQGQPSSSQTRMTPNNSNCG